MSANPADAGPVIPEWNLADRLRKIRRHVGLSQAEIAVKLDTNQRTYASWESEQSAPRNLVAVAKRIEALSGVPASWVLGLADSADTRRDTREYPAPSSITGRHLSLVRASEPTYPPISAENGSSVSASTDAESDDVPRWAVAVNDAHSA